MCLKHFYFIYTVQDDAWICIFLCNSRQLDGLHKSRLLLFFSDAITITYLLSGIIGNAV